MGEEWIETRRRGVFGWMFLLVFWGWNIWMARNTYRVLAGVGEDGSGAFSVIVFLAVWAIGSVITGLLAFMSRGGKRLIRLK